MLKRKNYFCEPRSEFALILTYYSRNITLYNTVIQYNNDSKDLQKAAKINVTLH